MNNGFVISRVSICYLLLVLTILSLFIVPHNYGTEISLHHLIIKFVVFMAIGLYTLTILFTNFSIMYRDKVYIFYLLVLFFFTIYRIALFQNIQELTAFFSLFIAFYILEEKQLKKNILFILGMVILTSFIIQSIYFTEDRLSISYQDPNITGYFLFLLFVLFSKLGSKIKYIVFLIGLLTLSRAFVLVFIFLFLFKFLKISNSIVYRLFLNNVYKICILLSVVTIAAVYYFGDGTLKEEVTEYAADKSRLVTLADESNRHRFLAITFFFNELATNREFRNLGEPDIKKYSRNVFINIPHNAFLDTIRAKGIYLGAFIILVYLRLLNRLYNKSNSPFIIGLLFYNFFLVMPLYSDYVLIVFFILCVNQDGRKV